MQQQRGVLWSDVAMLPRDVQVGPMTSHVDRFKELEAAAAAARAVSCLVAKCIDKNLQRANDDAVAVGRYGRAGTGDAAKKPSRVARIRTMG